MFNKFSLRIFAAAWAMLGVAANAQAPTNALAGQQLLQPGVLIARETAQVVFMSPDSAIEQVSIVSGKTSWISQEGAMPIALHQNQLLVLRDGAERGKLAYALLNVKDGQLLSRAFLSVPMPARALIDERLGESFKIETAGEGLRWSYRRELVPGALMDEAQDGGEKQAELSKLEGALAIDWTRGSLSPASNSSLKAAVVPPAEIGQASPDKPRNFRSVGGDYRLQSERLKDGRYRWLITDLSGTRLGEVVSDYSYRPFDVVGKLLVYVKPIKVTVAKGKGQLEMPTLTAINLRDGKVAWQREIRDTRYYGPFPS